LETKKSYKQKTKEKKEESAHMASHPCAVRPQPRSNRRRKKKDEIRGHSGWSYGKKKIVRQFATGKRIKKE